MDDLISRQAAIDALNEYFVRIGKLKRRGLNKGEKAIRLDAVGVINSLPPAQPEPVLTCEGCRYEAYLQCRSCRRKAVDLYEPE